ncbi:MAG: GNAT superfamily N-acetyltransferase [Flavobacteriaceae bacterium]|jgi:GNAT superfamily N-acetyltransferase
MEQEITIKHITTTKHYNDFVKFPFELYRNNQYWTPPIIKEEIETIDPRNNPVYENAAASFFLALRGGKIVGRIAAMVNWIEIKKNKKNKVRFGWFDVIDDVNVSKLLLDEVVAFGKEHKLDHIEGPVGFSNLDRAGLLIEGFEERNTMITLYNYPYYAAHLKELGFSILTQWVEYEIKITDYEKSPERVKRFSKVIIERFNLKVLKFNNKKEIVPYVDQMFQLLDETYNKLQTYVPIQNYQIKHYKKRYFKYVHQDFIKCIVDKNNRLIAFTITMPSFARALQKIKGKINLFNIRHLLKAMWFNNRASFYLIGVHPDYQNKGITAIIFNEIQKAFNKHNITIVETNPELEENTAIQKLWKNYENRQHKRRATFTKKI